MTDLTIMQNTKPISLLSLSSEALDKSLEEQVNALNLRHDGILVKILLAAEAYNKEAPNKALNVYLVGGAVRDLILGRNVRDLDVVIEGEITAVSDRLPDIEWRYYDRFMTASGILDTGEIDLITARSEYYEAPGRLPVVALGTIGEDLKRRDFTVNAMALRLTLLDYVPPENCSDAGRWILTERLDPLDGLEDLKAGSLRVLHGQSFYDDPTRLYRAVRYMTRLGLTPESATEAQMRKAIKDDALKTLTNDRIMRELFLNFSDGHPVESVQLMLAYGLLDLELDLESEAGLNGDKRQQAIDFANVVSQAPGLCGDDQASLLFGYFCLTSETFASHFHQCSLPRKLKNAARALTTAAPEALAKQLGIALMADMTQQQGHLKLASKEPSAVSSTDPATSASLAGPTSPATVETPNTKDAYSVKLDAFQGPMDLLLHLIQDNEIDIYDIPVATLCTQYLEYLTQMESARVDIAGEFLVMAATLLEIKSMMLLPDREAGIFEAWDVAEDPRTELVTKLVEYKRYKEAAKALSSLELPEGAYYTREASDLSEVLPENPEALNEPTEIDLLAEALRRVLTKLDRTDTHREHFFSTMHREPYAVEDAIKDLTARLKTSASITFEALFEGGAPRNVVVTTFLALLEMLKLKRIRVVQDEMFGGIVIEVREPRSEENTLVQGNLLDHWYDPDNEPQEGTVQAVPVPDQTPDLQAGTVPNQKNQTKGETD
ncbi:segregation/condensation protein A [Acidaminobacter hydrogenoformans]|uniref:Segregation and condensation protein A n=1 Tax=Acidaminobacter hydrogenoformans DSM 2784 TaxID=1120920 RepID=A0A1G5RTV3_9FIRM|nr:segregation/condensation protein A [Acidaminobacter hydrogenoformans]SCZ76749.1 condensin subunit ScpA [Acidaminobacter hydrogenoformans DSM 2784]